MEIVSSQISLASQRSSLTDISERTEVIARLERQAPETVEIQSDTLGKTLTPASPPLSLDQLGTQIALPETEVRDLSAEDFLRYSLMAALFQSLTGKKLEPPPQIDTSAPVVSVPFAPSQSSLSAPSAELLPATESSFIMERWQRVEQHDSLSFASVGQITTKDGRTIDIDLQMNLQRHMTQEQMISISVSGELKDPLVINFDNHSAQLTDSRYQFDIDADGTEDTLATLASGSGYLALDKNNNGEIDDGRELFGALSGDGFADLEQYDEDGNGFIDSGDSIFHSLKLWIQHDDGRSELVALAEKDIGAIYLGRSHTPWDLADDQNQLAGKIRQTGIYINNDGTTGTVQQIDLVT